MNRQDYYSQTEISRLLGISPKAVKQFIADHQIPVMEKDVDLGMYSIKALYCLKWDVEVIINKIDNCA